MLTITFTLTDVLLVAAIILFIFCSFLFWMIRKDTKTWERAYWDRRRMYADVFGNIELKEEEDA